MQSYHDMEGALRHEFFTGQRDADILTAMDARKAELEQKGATRFHRTKIGRNTTCPCGSGRKFKKCCMAGARVVGTR